jgi:hypothetical protein
MSVDALHWLMQWYSNQCNGDWEHDLGIEICSLDNPGWNLKIHLSGTTLEERPFPKTVHGEIAQDVDEWRRIGSWWIAEVKDGVFDAACGPLDLTSVLVIFRQWAEQATNT